jgi:hypothetical protein
MTDGYYSFGNQSVEQYPIPSNSIATGPVLQLADPLIYAMASFFSQLLNTNLLPRFQQEAEACGLTHANLDNFVDGYGVAQTIVFPLNEQLLRANDFKFPLLAIWPVHEEYLNLTLVYPATHRYFKVAWILPPLSAPQYNRLYPFLGLASKTILAYGLQGYDPKVSDVSVWQTNGIAFGYFHNASYEPYEGTSGKANTQAFFPTVEMEISFVERNQSPVVANFTEFTGIQDLQIDLYDGYAPASPIPTFIAAPIQPDVSITSCTPATGTIQGNTLVVIEGNGFNSLGTLGPSSLTFDGSPAAAMNIRSSTLIMAITSPSPNFPVYTGSIGPIVLTDNQGNAYSLATGWAYSTP